MPIYQPGTLNTAGLTVPNLYIYLQAPPTYINGITYGILGIVGTAPWGPPNKAVTLGGAAEYIASFGAIGSTAADLGVNVVTAARIGVSNFRVVRVTGTGAAAAKATSGVLTATGLYTGATGNDISVTVAAAAVSGQFTLTTSHPSLAGGTYTGATWQDLADALAADTDALISISATTMSGAATAISSFSLAGGADGSAPTTAQYMGAAAAAGVAGTGLYALTGQDCSLAVVPGCYDTTAWPSQAAFAEADCTYVVTAAGPGGSITSAVAAKAAAGITSEWVKVMVGDWVYTLDPTNGTMLLSPAIFAAAIMAARTPNLPALNAQINIITATQKTLKSTASSPGYTYADKQAIVSAGLDVIGNPSPGGNYFACQIGHNASPTDTIQSDTHPLMSAYIARTLDSGMGIYVGKNITPTLLSEIETTLTTFLSGLVSSGLLSVDSAGVLPYQVVCDGTNNSDAQIALGYVTATALVRYQGINEKFVINLQGGASVVISSTTAS